MIGWFYAGIHMGWAQRRLCRKGVPVFAYHKIGIAPHNTRDPFLYDSPRRFDQQLTLLKKFGFSSASLKDVPGNHDNSNRKAVITFDDGCLSVLEAGTAILARHNFRAIQFLVPGFMGKRNEWDIAKGDSPEPLMSHTQARDWLAAGHEIGSHSMTHRNLRHLSTVEAREEIVASRKALEDMFGVPVVHFSYPYGSWNSAVRDLAMEAGYLTACSMEFGINNRLTPPLELKRLFALSTTEVLRKTMHRLRRKAGF